MTRSKGWLFAAMASTLVATIAGQEPPRFRSDVRTVVMYATVQGRDGRLVTNLSQDDFEILEDGQRRPITTFSSETVPITATLMLDMSDSMRDYYERVREAAGRFVDALQPGDRVRIGTFGHTAALSPFLTSDKAILRRVLNEELWLSHFTALWTGIKKAMDSLTNEPGRRVIVVLTDGADACQLGIHDIWNQSPAQNGLAVQKFWENLRWLDLAHSGCVTIGDVRSQAIAGGFLIYVIGMPLGLSPDVSHLANDTGGAHFQLGKGTDLAATFDQVVTELRSQYVLGFSPERFDEQTHKLDLRMRPKGLSARSRKSYLASAK
jgi:Ca-activated chloride channel family protein